MIMNKEVLHLIKIQMFELKFLKNKISVIIVEKSSILGLNSVDWFIHPNLLTLTFSDFSYILYTLHCFWVFVIFNSLQHFKCNINFPGHLITDCIPELGLVMQVNYFIRLLIYVSLKQTKISFLDNWKL